MAEQDPNVTPQPGVETPPANPPKDRTRKLKPAPMKKGVAAELIEARNSVRSKADAEARAKDDEENVYYLKCPRVQGHIAAFLTSNVRSIITPSDWESVLHPAGEPWRTPAIACQECIADGESRHWNARVRPTPRRDGSFDFVIDGERRHAVGSIPRSEFESTSDRIGAAFGKTTEAAK